MARLILQTQAKTQVLVLAYFQTTYKLMSLYRSWLYYARKLGRMPIAHVISRYNCGINSILLTVRVRSYSCRDQDRLVFPAYLRLEGDRIEKVRMPLSASSSYVLFVDQGTLCKKSSIFNWISWNRILLTSVQIQS
jgi:hypothetical protein